MPKLRVNTIPREPEQAMVEANRVDVSRIVTNLHDIER